MHRGYGHANLARPTLASFQFPFLSNLAVSTTLKLRGWHCAVCGVLLFGCVPHINLCRPNLTTLAYRKGFMQNPKYQVQMSKKRSGNTHSYVKGGSLNL